MIELSEELRQAMRVNPSYPIELTDPDTNESYTLVRTKVFDRIRKLILSDDPQEFVEAGYRLSMEAFREAWDDPAMSAYDALDPRNQ